MQWTQPVVKRKILMPQTVYFLSSPAFYVSCLHWREGKMEIGRWEVVVVCRKEFMGSKVVVMLRCIFISTTSQCTLLPINWQVLTKQIFSFETPKGNIWWHKLDRASKIQLLEHTCPSTTAVLLKSLMHHR